MSQNLPSVPSEINGSATVALEDAINPFVKKGIAYWRSLCGQRRFPARADLTLRGMAAILPFTVIVGVVDGGTDFEFRYVGEEQRAAFKTSFKGIRVSQIQAALPPLGNVLRNVYEQARLGGTPFIVRGRIDHEPADSRLLYHETVFLPLGAGDDAVDHLLIVGVQIPTPFWDVTADELDVLTDRARAQAVSAASATAP